MQFSFTNFRKPILNILIVGMLFLLSTSSTCKYGFKNVSIPPEVKTFRVNYLTNKAQYVNPQLSPQLTEKLKSKIIGNTRLRQVNGDDAHYDISGSVTQYYTSTTGITGSTASTNRLNISFHLILKNNLDDKKSFEADVSTYIDFPATQSLTEAEASNSTKIVSNIVDEIFNKIFANW